MFTLHFILLSGLSTLQIAVAQNTDNELVNLGNDSGIISTPGKSLTPTFPQPLEDESSDDYPEDDFQDNRLRLMLQPKKALTLNETKLRLWPPNSSSAPIITYRNSFAVKSSEGIEISGNEVTKNISKENSNVHETVKDSTIINTTSTVTLVSLNNKTWATATAAAYSEQWPNEKSSSITNEKSKTEADSKPIQADLTNVTEEKNSSATTDTGKFLAPLPPSLNASSLIENETFNNSTATSESPLTDEPVTQNISNTSFKEPSEQEEGTSTTASTTASTDAVVITVEQTTQPNFINETQNMGNDNFYEELEPENLSEETFIDYITPNETAVDETNTVLIVLPGSDVGKMANSTGTGTYQGKPYISQAISQNLLHLLMNLTAITAVNERNGKKILTELQEQKAQLQSLREQSHNIYSYITKIKNNTSK